MTITLSHLNSVPSARMSDVLALSGPPFSSRQLVSFVKFPSYYNQYHTSNDYTHFSWKLCTSRVRPLTIVPSRKRFSRCFSCSSNRKSSTSLEEKNCDNSNDNNANTRPLSYDRLGGSSSSLSLCSSSRSCSSDSQNTSPTIQINIVLPQLSTVAMLANVYRLLDHLMMLVRHGSLFFFQVAVSDKKRALRRKLNKIAKNGDTSTSDGLNHVFKEVVKALLQYDDSSIHFTRLFTRHGSMKNINKNFKFLNRELERHGKDENTSVNVEDNVEYKSKASSTKNEYTVVSVLVVATGKHLIPIFNGKGAKSNDSSKVLKTEEGRCYHSFDVLQTLQRIPQNEIQSVEVLWSPRKEDEVLLEDKLLINFPLTQIKNGLIRGKVGSHLPLSGD